MPRVKLRLFRRAHHNRHVAIEAEGIKFAQVLRVGFRSLANISSSALRFASFPGRFGDESSAFLVAVNDWSPKSFSARHAGSIRIVQQLFECSHVFASRPSRGFTAFGIFPIRIYFASRLKL